MLIGVSLFMLSCFGARHWDTGNIPIREPAPAWCVDLGLAWANVQVADDGTIFVAVQGKPLQALDVETGAVRWRSDSVILGYPWKILVRKTRIVVSDSSDGSVNILCLQRETGALLWKKNVQRSVEWKHFWLDATDDVVAATGDDLTLTVFAIDDGRELWARQLRGSHVNEFLIERALCYYEISPPIQGRILALDPLSGNLLWEVPMSSMYTFLSRLNERSILVHPYGKPLSAYDARTGALLWKVEAIKFSRFFLTLNDGAGLYGMMFDPGTIDRILLSIDPDSGKTRWSVSGDSFVELHPLQASYLYTDGAFPPTQRDMSTGVKNWEANIPCPGRWCEPVIRGIREEGSEVFFVIQDVSDAPFWVYAVDLQTGVPVWVYPSKGEPTLLPARRLLIRDEMLLKLVKLPQ